MAQRCHWGRSPDLCRKVTSASAGADAAILDGPQSATPPLRAPSAHAPVDTAMPRSSRSDPSNPSGSKRWWPWVGLTLLWLPNRTPELNPMDTLWGQAKDVVSANRQYETIEEHVRRFLEHLEGLSGRETLHTAGVLSDDFWLKEALSKNFCRPA